MSVIYVLGAVCLILLVSIYLKSKSSKKDVYGDYDNEWYDKMN